VFLAIFGWIDGRCWHAAGCIRLVAVFLRKEFLLSLAVMDAFNNLWSYKGAFCYDSLQRYHMVQVNRAQGSGVAREFAKAAYKGTIVDLCALACCRV
jgi:hypothetical protein